MVKTYLLERRSWIVFFIFQNLLLLFIAYIDPKISLPSIAYVTFLMTLILLLFLAFRYQKETKFYKALQEREKDFDLTRLIKPDSPFEQMIESSFIEQIDYLKTIASKNQVMLEQEKDDLLSWIHEVKTPLTAMHLMVEKIEDNTLKSQITYEWLRIHLLLDQQLHQKRLLFIENDLLIERTDLEALLFQELKTLQSWCIQKGIGFDIDLQKTEVLSDTKWLAFIVRQLLTNAVKYSDHSDIYMKSYQQDEHTYLQIQDFGRGIDEKDLPRIFDKGFTSTTNHDDQSATGMGLYLAKKVAKSLLIEITIQSEVGVGTTIILTFPKRNDFVKVMSM